MATVSTPYTLAPSQLEAAFEALRRADAAFRPSPLQARLYRWLGRCAKLAAAAAVGAVATLFFLPVLAAIFGLVFFLATAAAVLLLAPNLPQIMRAIRQRQLLKKLGLHTVSLSAWKAERRRRLGGWLGAYQTAVGTGLLVIGLFLFIVLVLDRDADGVPIVLGATAAFVVPAVTILTWRMLERSRQQFALAADVDRLRDMLTAMQATSADGGTVVVPAAVLESVATIEQAQIAQDRARAVAASVATGSRGYGLVLAPDVTMLKSTLDPDERLTVEDLIDEVLAAPQTSAQGETEVQRAATPDRLIEVGYRVDAAALRIHVVGLRVGSRSSGPQPW